MRGRVLSTRLASVLTFILFLAAWELAGNAGLVSATFFPAPSRIWAALVKLARSGDLAAATGSTLLRFAVGLIAGSALGALLGLLMGWWPRLRVFLDPVVAAIYPLPKIAIYPLIMVIFGLGEQSKFVAVALAAFFPMLITSLAGVQQINRVYFEVGRNYGARGGRFLTRILLPGSLPSILAGLRLSSNMAFVVTITVEIVAASTGLGVLLWFGWQTFRVSEIYAVLVVIGLVGLAISYGISHLTRLLVPWMGE
jgi:NitT/TauT family transport system permease protein